jgi:hypothetical protein
VPVVRRADREQIDEGAQCPRSDEHAAAERDEPDESLCGGAQITRRFLVAVDLPRDGEEVVANPVLEPPNRPLPTGWADRPACFQFVIYVDRAHVPAITELPNWQSSFSMRPAAV